MVSYTEQINNLNTYRVYDEVLRDYVSYIDCQVTPDLSDMINNPHILPLCYMSMNCHYEGD
jgi:hypothetical protein